MVATVIASEIESKAPMTRQEAADYLRCHPDHLAKLAAVLRPVKVGKRLLFDRERVKAFARGELA